MSGPVVVEDMVCSFSPDMSSLNILATLSLDISCHVAYILLIRLSFSSACLICSHTCVFHNFNIPFSRWHVPHAAFCLKLRCSHYLSSVVRLTYYFSSPFNPSKFLPYLCLLPRKPPLPLRRLALQPRSLSFRFSFWSISADGSPYPSTIFTVVLVVDPLPKKTSSRLNSSTTKLRKRTFSIVILIDHILILVLVASTSRMKVNSKVLRRLPGARSVCSVILFFFLNLPSDTSSRTHARSVSDVKGVDSDSDDDMKSIKSSVRHIVYSLFGVHICRLMDHPSTTKISRPRSVSKANPKNIKNNDDACVFVFFLGTVVVFGW